MAIPPQELRTILPHADLVVVATVTAVESEGPQTPLPTAASPGAADLPGTLAEQDLQWFQ